MLVASGFPGCFRTVLRLRSVFQTTTLTLFYFVGAYFVGGGAAGARPPHRRQQQQQPLRGSLDVVDGLFVDGFWVLPGK